MNFRLILMNFDYLEPVVDVLNQITIPLISLLAAFGAIYAIILGVGMAKADSSEKRTTSKKRIVNALVTLIILIALILLLKLVLQNLPVWFGDGT